jgi:Ubiquitin carboxyl-terminal hydrolase
LSDASQQMLIEALPPVLVLHLKRFRYDAAAGGVIKIGKPVRFPSQLEIPLGMIFTFLAAAGTENYFVIWSFQTLWYPVLNDPLMSRRITSFMECSTITANLQAADTIPSMFFVRKEMATQEKFGCTSMMKQ